MITIQIFFQSYALNMSNTTAMPLLRKLSRYNRMWKLYIIFIIQVDRSGGYAARWAAKSLVAAKLCKRCLIQISYAIGVAEPLSITVQTYGTGRKSDAELLKIVKKNFDFRPGIVVR